MARKLSNLRPGNHWSKRLAQNLSGEKPVSDYKNNISALIAKSAFSTDY